MGLIPFVVVSCEKESEKTPADEKSNIQFALSKSEIDSIMLNDFFKRRYNMRVIFLFVFLLLNLFYARGQQQKRIPDIKFEWLDKVNNKKLDNRILILDFWATWCGPCINAIPHYNNLAEEFSGDEVVFLSVNSFDDKEKIEEFIEKRNIKFKSSVVLDHDKELYNMLGIKSIPAVFIIDRNKKVRWKGNPGQLTQELLHSFIQYDSIPPPPKIEPNPFSIKISQNLDTGKKITRAIFGESVKYHFTKRQPQVMIEQFLAMRQIKSNEMRFIKPFPIVPRIDLKLEVPASMKEHISEMGLDAILKYLNFSADTLWEEQEVIEITDIDTNTIKKYEIVDLERPQIDLNNEKRTLAIQFYRLSRILHVDFDLPVYNDVSEAWMRRNFRIEYPMKYEAMKKHLKEKYGIELHKTKRKVKVWKFWANEN